MVWFTLQIYHGAELKVLVEDGQYCLKKPSVQGEMTREVQGRTMAFENNTAHLKKSTFNHALTS